MLMFNPHRWFRVVLRSYILCWCSCPQIGTSSADGAQLGTLLPEDRDRIQSLKCCISNMKSDDG
jgi:hypothetical protein